MHDGIEDRAQLHVVVRIECREFACSYALNSFV